MSETPNKRRWYQFSLRTLFVVVTLAAIPLGWFGWQADLVRQRKAMLEEIRASSMDTVFEAESLEEDTLPWYRRLLGDVKIVWIVLPAEQPEQTAAVQKLFPEALVLGYSPR